MTDAEVTAFNSGILTVCDLAARAAEALKPQLADRPLHIPFAIEALKAVAEEGRSLLKGSDGIAAVPAPPPGPRSTTVAAAE